MEFERVRSVAQQDMAILAAALGDSPETVITHHLLTTRACDAWIVGDVRQPRAALIQAHAFPAEPTAFGADARDIARMLPFAQGWECVCAPLATASDLERPVANLTAATSLRTLDDVYHVLDNEPAVTDLNPMVRLLTDDDALLLASLDGIQQSSPYRPIVAAGVVDGEVVGLAHTFAWSPLYVDIGVSTHESFRQQGIATAAATLVAREVRKRGRIPVWSCGDTNVASLRTAARIGFRETSRKRYVIPDQSPEQR